MYLQMHGAVDVDCGSAFNLGASHWRLAQLLRRTVLLIWKSSSLLLLCGETKKQNRSSRT